MSVKQDLEAAVAKIFGDRWNERSGRTVPAPEELSLGNDAVKLDGTVLYADMTDSTKLVDSHAAVFAAEVYKAYLVCAARLIKAEGGTITAYDGDRVMAVFIGDYKNSSAAKAALKINHAVREIVNPALARHYANQAFRLQHVVGIDTSSLMAARIGVRNDNDLVWVGRSANYAAKLAGLGEPNTVFITDEVFRQLSDDCKYGGNPKRLMWSPKRWSQRNDMSIHASTWSWPV